jgi:hypothetical protein
MNFDEAVAVHQRWKTKLRIVIDGKSLEVLDPKTVCKDDQCELGKWIYGEGGRSMSSKPEFRDVKITHADFHLVAGNVLRKALAGDKAGASILLDGDFYNTSSKVIQAITKCKAVCK